MPECRSPFGALMGGALAAYLLGPQLERMRDKQGKAALCDIPLISTITSKI